MSGKLLVASHLSALFPSPHPITIFSTQKEFVKLLARNDSTPPQHASYSMLFHTPETGTILLRVSHGGLMLELLSLSTELPPLRFDFPAQILPSPSIVMWGSEELHVLAVTVVGSLYRIVLPVRADAPLWQSESDPNRRWYREYVIQHPRPDLKGVVQVQGPYCVALSMPNGSLLRLDAEQLGDDYDDDVWKETVFDHHSFLQSITSLLPTLHSGPPGASEIISMASHPQPTDIGNIWTLSRDRCLRLWTARGGEIGKVSSLDAVKSNEVRGGLSPLGSIRK
ncbi:hypothetical protein A0H81_08208 [Grifola frondosa]|uniref:Nucleoporin Nup120/160 beta-propeller domain-containing protein n=1 Tax=Grifola frondosa TaxID=5627 RepID=A0A1C7M5X3_GRIFR|nr:hypothetical protein A0H81_08208 [Grifola frondosa]